MKLILLTAGITASVMFTFFTIQDLKHRYDTSCGWSMHAMELNAGGFSLCVKDE